MQFNKTEENDPENESPYLNNDELLDDADQSSLEDIDDQGNQEEAKAQNPGEKIRITYPEPPADFDKNKYADEFERYEPSNVAEAMYARKERKIPGSVMKPHSPYVNLVQTNILKGPQKQIRVLFPYPQYCFRLKTQPDFLKHIDM